MKHKNIGPFLAFTKDWFLDHQRGLLWLLNTWLIGRWFKWVLCIRSCDIGYSREILEILPHCYTVAGEEEGTYTTDFRTHPKYAKRIYFAFRPLWWMLHAWDWLVADRWWPEWGFGFASLTVYPDPDPETNTVDGSLARAVTDETWTTIINGAGTFSQDSSTTDIAYIYMSSSSTSGGWRQNQRTIQLFDTSALSSTTVISADLSVYIFSKADSNAASPSLELVSSAPATNTALVNADYSTLGSTRLASALTYSSLITSAYNTFSLNSSGLSNINKDGVSKFGTKNNYDVDASDPPWVFVSVTNIRGSFADASGSSEDPRLVITYTLASRFTAANRLRPRLFRPGLAR